MLLWYDIIHLLYMLIYHWVYQSLDPTIGSLLKGCVQMLDLQDFRFVLSKRPNSSKLSGYYIYHLFEHSKILRSAHKVYCFSYVSSLTKQRICSPKWH
jgi:hypothetical protein